jgi:hypothetical protein
VSDRLLWLEEWCPECRAAPGARCRCSHWSKTDKRLVVAVARLHVARGWRERRCPTCKAGPREPCRTPSGREAPVLHAARRRPARNELAPSAVWEELQRLEVTIAVVPFLGRAGRGGRTDAIRLSRVEGGQLVEVERRLGRDQLAHALEAPVWDRYGAFAGHPLIRGTVRWTTADRRVVIDGMRGSERLEEIVG